MAASDVKNKLDQKGGGTVSKQQIIDRIKKGVGTMKKTNGNMFPSLNLSLRTVLLVSLVTLVSYTIPLGGSGKVEYFPGNIGIGILSPTAQIDVSGDMKASGTVTANKFAGSIDYSYVVGAPALSGGNIITANIALTANKLATMNVGQFSNDAQYVTQGALDAVAAGALPNDAVTSAKILDGTITSLDVADNAIVDSKILTVNASKVVGTVGLATTANHATTSDYASNAGLLDGHAESALNVATAVTAGSAGSATSALTSITSNIALTSTTANIALTANYVAWSNVGNPPNIVTVGMVVASSDYATTANVAITANYATLAGTAALASNAGLLSGHAEAALNVASALMATTANIALTANYVAWSNVGNPPNIVTVGMVVASSDFATTANTALQMNASGLLGALTVSTNGAIDMNVTMNAKGSVVYSLPGAGPYVVLAGTTIPVTTSFIKVAPTAARDLTAVNPQIAAGTDGQQLILMGTSDTNTVKLGSGNGLVLFGGVSFTLGFNDILRLVYSDSNWYEISRSDN